MIVYDEDSFFGSGEYEVLTVSEVYSYLTEEEKLVFNKLCDISQKRRRKVEIKKNICSRGYSEARDITNSYKGNYN